MPLQTRLKTLCIYQNALELPSAFWLFCFQHTGVLAQSFFLIVCTDHQEIGFFIIGRYPKGVPFSFILRGKLQGQAFKIPVKEELHNLRAMGLSCIVKEVGMVPAVWLKSPIYMHILGETIHITDIKGAPKVVSEEKDGRIGAVDDDFMFCHGTVTCQREFISGTGIMDLLGKRNEAD